ncbi:DUF427 domain-containing protein [Flagellimonas abyssi]|jgi:uncharacterized protein (DUF427 family)|uniref:DUF427 domain-containing protein n=1 Tax=Flagellimonas abyssi TaxID=2864871 RepID=A0ABS7EWJ7_9FLAO|nr:DUF427 domain-containing protein [Allomuricauda abyssi]MBW8201127.1 DUF427 domain-containing protein [Allomuricauda abyssi]
MKVIWNNQSVAESIDTVIMEINHYFPPYSLKSEYFKDSETISAYHFIGTALHRTTVVKGEVNEKAAWYCLEPSALAKGFAGYYTFWNNVKIEE